MRHRYSDIFAPVQLVLDTALLNLSFLVAFVVRGGLPEFLPDFILQNQYLLLWLFFNLLWFMLQLILKPYRYSRVDFNADKLLIRLTEITFWHAAIIAIFWISVQGYYYSRGHLVLTYLIFYALGLMWRFAALFFIKVYRASGYNARKYIVIGKGPLSDSITAFYESHPEIGYRFYGYFEEPGESSGGENKTRRLEEFVVRNGIDYIYCCLPYLKNDYLKEIISISERHHSNVKLIVDFRGFLTNKVEIEYHDFMPVINLSTKPFSNVRDELGKRVFDLAFSLIVVILASPIFILIALLVKLTSAGSAMFVQERSGRWGKPFNIYKFRTMVVDSDKIAQRHSKGDNDLRITSIGKFLRKTRLDELPQFFNVIKGDMSIVGPRPLARYDVDMLMTESPKDFKRLLTIRPGITSIGQIKVGYADNAKSSVKRLQYDLMYLDNASWQTDLWLIARTILLMVQGKGK